MCVCVIGHTSSCTTDDVYYKYIMGVFPFANIDCWKYTAYKPIKQIALKNGEGQFVIFYSGCFLLLISACGTADGW